MLTPSAVIKEWHTAPAYISALYANKKGQSSALRAFLDHLSRAMGSSE
jgi:DNA-binding transcriptional LysR family regulator